MQRLMKSGLLGVCWAGIVCSTVLTGEPSPPEPASELQRFEFLQIRMGVPFRIVLYATDEPAANDAAKAAYRRLRELNRTMSDYDPDSELMRLCRSSGPGRPVEVSPELFFVLSRSLVLSRKTEGAFDVTVGPVVKLWRIAARRKQLPDAKDLAAARKLVGYEHLRLDEEARTVELRKKGMRLDLGGIAKGYAGDEALKVLRKHGIGRALIDGGGDIVTGEPPPGKDGWTIQIEQPALGGETEDKPTSRQSDTGARGQGEKEVGHAPHDEPRELRASLRQAVPDLLLVNNAAIATSGDAYQYIEIDGTRYSHIVDPQTGLGLTTPSSVTVIAPDGLTADSLASAVSVLGPQRGLKLIETTEQAAALIVQRADHRLQTFASERLADYRKPGIED